MEWRHPSERTPDAVGMSDVVGASDADRTRGTLSTHKKNSALLCVSASLREILSLPLPLPLPLPLSLSLSLVLPLILPPILSLTLVLGLPTGARADEPALLENPEVAFRVDIDPVNVTVGNRFKVVLDLSYPAGTRVFFPETPVTRPFALVAHDRDQASIAGTATGERHVLTLLPVRIGAAVLPPLDVPYVSAAGEAKTARTPEIRIQVAGTLADETDPQPASPGEPVPVRVLNVVLVWALSALAVALLASLTGILGYRAWRRWREAHRPPPPPRPAHEVAYERLAAIEAMALVEAGEFQQLALLVSEVVREFLGAVHGFSGVDRTSWEVLRLLDGRDLGRLTLLEVEDFLGLCDLVKFAKFKPSEDEARSLTRRAREMVDRVLDGPSAPSPAVPEAIHEAATDSAVDQGGAS